MLEEKILIWRFNCGRRQVLREIYEKYKDELITLAAALLYDKAEAEDCVHDVFASFIRATGKFRLTRSLKGYLATAVANTARNRNREKARLNNTAIDQIAPTASDTAQPDALAIFGEESKQLSWALGQLPYEQREVIMLRLYSRMKFKAIAKSQEVSINTVQGRYRYGIDKLRSLLNGEVIK